MQNGCVCQMWSPREQFAVEVFPPQENFIDVECPKTGPESRIYIFGGFGSRIRPKVWRNACNLEYREYYHDVWRSKKECIKLERNEDPTGCRSEHAWFAQEWEMVTPAAPWRGRGGHHGGAPNETISDGWAGWKYSRPVRPPTPERCVVKRRWSYMGSENGKC